MLWSTGWKGKITWNNVNVISISTLALKTWPGVDLDWKYCSLNARKDFEPKSQEKWASHEIFFKHDLSKLPLSPYKSSCWLWLFFYTFQFILFWTLHVTYFILAWDVFDEIIESLDILVITISDMVLARCDSLDFHWWSTKLTWHMKPLLHHKNANTKIQKWICILFRVWLFG